MTKQLTISLERERERERKMNYRKFNIFPAQRQLGNLFIIPARKGYRNKDVFPTNLRHYRINFLKKKKKIILNPNEQGRRNSTKRIQLNQPVTCSRPRRYRWVPPNCMVQVPCGFFRKYHSGSRGMGRTIRQSHQHLARECNRDACRPQ